MLLTFAAAIALAVGVQAADQTYRDGDADNTWSTSTSVLNWDGGTPWVNGNNAVFGGTAETVTLGSAITAGTVTFNTADYIIDTAGNNLALSGGTAGTGAGTSTIILSGGSTISSADGVTIASTIQLGSGGGNIAGGTGNYGNYTGRITGGTAGSTSLTINAGHVAISNPANDFLGNVSVGPYYLKPTASEVIPDTAVVSITGSGGLKLNPASAGTYTETIGGLSGAGYGTWAEGAGVNYTLKLGYGSTSTHTYTGSIFQSGAVLALEKVGAGTQFLSNVGNSFTGNITVGAGTLAGIGGTASGSTSSPFGYKSSGRTITVNSGGTLLLTATTGSSNTFGGGGMNASQIPTLVINGGIVQTGRFNTIGNVTLQNGGALTNSSTETSGSYGGYQFIGDVTVSGTGSGTLINNSGSTRPDHLKNGTTTFTVADITASTAADLTVSTELTDGSGDYGGKGALVKAGAGTMAVSTRASYTGGTTISEGVLDLTGGGGQGGTIRGTVTVGPGATLRLSTTDATGWGTGDDRVSVLNLNGGTLDVNTTGNQTVSNLAITMTGATISGIAGSNLDMFNNRTGITTLASATSSVISIPKLGLRQDNSTFTVADGAAAPDLVVSSVLWDSDGSGNNALIKNGAGTMRLTNVNTFTGALAINSGTLEATAGTSGGNASAIGNGANTINIAAGATLLFSTNNRTAGYHSGAVNLNGGTITFNTDDNSFAAGRTLAFDTAAGTINGSGQWRMRDAGAKVSVASAASGSTIGVNQLTLTGAIADGYVFDVADGPAAGDLTISSTIGGHFGGESIVKAGAGTLALSKTNTYTGGTTVNGGVLDLTGGGGSAGTIRGTATVNTGGTLRLSTGDATGYGGGSTALTVINLVGGTLDNNQDARIPGRNQTLGSATVNMTGGQITGIAGSNLDFFGGASALNTLASATTSTISGAAIDIRQSQGVTFTVADGAAAVDLDISSMITNQAPTASGPGTGTSYGNNPLIKEGDGTMRISGTANNYTGATGVAAGTLVVDGSIEDSGLTTVGSGATLAGSGTVGTTEVYGTLAPSGTLVPGNGIGTLTILGSLTLGVGDEGAADFEINRDADQTADLVMIKGGLLTYAGTLNVANNSTSALQLNDTFRLFNWDEGSIAEFDFDLVNLPGLAGGLTWRNDLKTLGSITVVPEPASVLGLSLVLSSALLFRRRNG